jgi:hypothetical protein
VLLFGVTITAAVPQKSEIPEGLMNYPVFLLILVTLLSMGNGNAALKYYREILKFLPSLIVRKVEKILSRVCDVASFWDEQCEET